MDNDSSNHPFETSQDLQEQLALEQLESDPEYWDHLDELEARYGGGREWDDVVLCGN